jgi:hypothetical protein
MSYETCGLADWPRFSQFSHVTAAFIHCQLAEGRVAEANLLLSTLTTESKQIRASW